MTATDLRSEITVPAAIFDALHHAATDPARDEGSAWLARAGSLVGPSVLEAATDGEASDGDAGAMPVDDFWAALRNYMSGRGWGMLDHERIHPGLGLVRATDWVEADVGGPCTFTAGVLSGLFTTLAGRRIEVLELPRGTDGPIEFVFGSAEAVGALRRLVDAGADLSDALGAL
jgi:hypothetical protein